MLVPNGEVGMTVIDFKSLDAEIETITKASAVIEIASSNVLALTGLLNRIVIDLSIGTSILFDGFIKLNPNEPTLILSNSILPTDSSSLQEISISKRNITQRISKK